MFSSLSEGLLLTQTEYNLLRLSRVAHEYDLLLVVVWAVPDLSEQISLFLGEYETPGNFSEAKTKQLFEMCECFDSFAFIS